MRQYPVKVDSDRARCLCEQNQEHNQQTEQSDGLSQGKAEQSVSNQLLGNVGVAGSSVDQGAEHHTETCTHTREGNGGAASTDVLGGSQDAHGAHLLRLADEGRGSCLRADALGKDAGVQAKHGGAL